MYGTNLNTMIEEKTKYLLDKKKQKRFGLKIEIIYNTKLMK